MTVEHNSHEQQLVLARGLPGSGKTTWFKQSVLPFGSCIRYISRDDLRFMLVGQMWNPRRERAVTDARDTLIRKFLSEGYCVIADETFLNPKALTHVKAIAAEFPGVVINEKDFTDVDIDVCVERDLHRGDRAVGAGVIRSLAKQWLRAPAPTPNPVAHEAIIVDLDGTLALFGDASPYDRDFSQDTLNPAVARIVQRMATSNVRIIITSGRKDKYLDVTKAWLKEHDIPYDRLFMRPATEPDMKDSLLKFWWYRTDIRPNFNVLFVLDDRDCVVDMWRLEGLTCLQVDYGAF